MTWASALVPNVGSVSAGQRMVAQRRGELARSLRERRAIGRFHALPARRVDDDHLHAFGAHDGTQAAPPAMPRRTMLDIGHRDAGRRTPHFAGRPNADAGDLVAKPFELACHGLVVAQPGQRVGLLDLDPVAIHDQPVEMPAAGFPSITSARMPSAAKAKAAMPPEFDSLIVPVSGLLAPADRRPAHGAPGPGEDPRRQDQLVLRRQRMAGRRHFVRDERTGQAASRQPGVLLARDAPRTQTDPTC